MNFFGIGLFEILLVLVFALVVLGPERLQTLGRQAGKLTAQWLAWQQSSPELQAVQRIRSEFEAEINALRDEILRAKQQLNVSAEVQRLQEEGRSIQFPQVMQDKLKVEPPQAASSDLPAPADSAASSDNLPESAPIATGDQAESVGMQAAGSPPASPAPATIDTARPEPPAPLEGTVPHTVAPVPAVAAPAASPEADLVADPLGNGHYSEVEIQLKLLSEQITQLQGELQAMRRLLATRGIVDTSRYAPPEEQEALRQ
jgi:sec-independent protein translocase protein TatB